MKLWHVIAAIAVYELVLKPKKPNTGSVTLEFGELDLQMQYPEGRLRT